MSRRFATVLIVACFAASLAPSARGDERPKADAKDQPTLCDVYGPGFEPVGGSAVCVKIGVSVTVGVRSGGRGNPVASSSDWIRTASPAHPN
jgi:hypothetical protein